MHVRPGVKAPAVEVVGGNGVWLVHGVAPAAAGAGGGGDAVGGAG